MHWKPSDTRALLIKLSLIFVYIQLTHFISSASSSSAIIVGSLTVATAFVLHSLRVSEYNSSRLER